MKYLDTIKSLLDERPIPGEKIIAEMARASRLAESADLDVILTIAMLDDTYDEIIAVPAMACLPAWGIEGIRHLCEFVVNGPHNLQALSILACVSLSRIPNSADIIFLEEDWDKLEKYKLDSVLVPETIRCLRELILDQLAAPEKKKHLFGLISRIMLRREESARVELFDFLVDLLFDTHLILNKEILGKFESLLNEGPKKEEQIHQFLVENPVLLDPFVIELRNKHELGDDFITDFVVRRTNNEYVVVEIENSTDKIFKQDGSFTQNLMTAVGQVRDFQAWISDNIAYAQTKLLGIRHPDGLVVIGRRETLSGEMAKRLSEENFSRRGNIKIVTYDDLLSQGKSVYHNIIERPVVLRSRDQKSI